MYFVHGQYMNYTQVCARAVQLYNFTGYQDPECARIIAHHSSEGQNMAFGDFQVNNFDHPIRENPRQYRQLDGAPVDVLPFADYPGLGLNHDNLGFDHSDPATPTRHGQTNLGGFMGQDSNTAGRLGYGHGIKHDLTFTSPAAFNPGGRMSQPNDYRTPDKPKSSASFGTPGVEHNDMRINPFGVVGMGAGDGSSQGFNDNAYSRHLAATEAAIGNSPGANNVGNRSHVGSARNNMISGAGNVGRFTGPGSSASANEMTSPQDTFMAGRSSSNAASSPAPGAADKDAHLMSTYLTTSDDGSGSNK